MGDRIFISISPDRTDFFRWNGENLVQALRERAGEGSRIGGIYLGRVTKVEPSLNAISDAFADELSRNIDFFRSSFKVDRLDRIFLSGGGAKVAGLTDVLGDKLRVSVDRLNPFQLLELDDRSVDPAAVREIGCAAAVVVGLALRHGGDR